MCYVCLCACMCVYVRVCLVFGPDGAGGKKLIVYEFTEQLAMVSVQ